MYHMIYLSIYLSIYNCPVRIFKNPSGELFANLY